MAAKANLRHKARMDFRHIKLEQSPAQVATLTLNRPDSLNALNAGMIEEMRAALASLPGTGARCLLLTGEGRAFSSGADLVAGGGLPDDVGAALESHLNPLIEDVFDLPMPVVAAVGGAGAGGGPPPPLAAAIVISFPLAFFFPG